MKSACPLLRLAKVSALSGYNQHETCLNCVVCVFGFLAVLGFKFTTLPGIDQIPLLHA